jgi:DNA polymerase-1
MTTILYDADPLCYRFAFRNTATYDWGDGVVSNVNDADNACEEIRRHIADVAAELKADLVVLALSDDKANWRKALYPEYKANRGEKPEMIPALREFMQKEWYTFIRPTLEADDVLGILATSGGKIGGRKIIVSIDKDMKTIPGLLYNPNHPKDGVVKIVQSEADYNHMFQTLTGDRVDNYPGCVGVGPKKAEKILEGENGDTLWERVVDAYIEHGLTKKDALLNARLARICRASDYDFKKRRVRLWNPPK